MFLKKDNLAVSNRYKPIAMKKYFLALLFLLLVTTVFAQTWENLKTQNECTNRHENALVAVGDQLVLVGGRGIKPVETFEFKSNSWTKKVETPLEMHHFQAVAYKNELWVLGGFTGGYPHEKPIPNIYIFNPQKNEWRKGADIPQDRLRGAAGVFVYQNKIYIVCGIQDGHWDGHVGWLDEYDPKTNSWRKLPDAPHVRDHVHAALIDHKIYIAGGRRSTARIGQVLNLTEPAVDVFDFKTNTWTTLPESQNLPTRRAGASSVAWGKKLLVIGGESDTQVPAHSEVEALDTQTLTWEKLPNLQKGRHGTGAINYKGNIYIVAGSGNRGGGPELNSVEVLK